MKPLLELLLFIILSLSCGGCAATPRKGDANREEGALGRRLASSSKYQCPNYDSPLIVVSFTTSYKRLTSAKGESFLQHFVRDMLNIPRLLLVRSRDTAVNSTTHNYLFDRVYMHVPLSYSVRFGGYPVPVPRLPEWLERLRNSSDSYGRFVMNRPAVDYGPSTKVLPIILLPETELPPCSIVVQVDEDELYDDINLNTLVAASLVHPDKLFGGLGWPVTNIVDDQFDWAAWERSTTDKNHQQNSENHLKRFLVTKRIEPEVPLSTLHSSTSSNDKQEQVYGAVRVKRNDLLLGVRGIVYRKRHFQEELLTSSSSSSPSSEEYSPFLNFATHSVFQRHCIYVDDVWLSGHMERLGREKFGITTFPEAGTGKIAIDQKISINTDGANRKPKEKGPLDRLAYGLRNTDRLSYGPTQRFDNAFCALGLIDQYHIWGYPATEETLSGGSTNGISAGSGATDSSNKGSSTTTKGPIITSNQGTASGPPIVSVSKNITANSLLVAKEGADNIHRISSSTDTHTEHSLRRNVTTSKPSSHELQPQRPVVIVAATATAAAAAYTGSTSSSSQSSLKGISGRSTSSGSLSLVALPFPAGKPVGETWKPNSIVYTEDFKRFSLCMRKPFDPNAKPPTAPPPSSGGDEKPARISLSSSSSSSLSSSRPRKSSSSPNKQQHKSETTTAAAAAVVTTRGAAAASTGVGSTAIYQKDGVTDTAASAPSVTARKNKDHNDNKVTVTSESEVSSSRLRGGKSSSSPPIHTHRGSNTNSAATIIGAKRLSPPVKQQLVTPA